MDVGFGPIIILAAAVAFIVRLYFSHQERRRRLEILPKGGRYDRSWSGSSRTLHFPVGR